MFDAEVYPDLSPARTVAGLIGHYASRAKQAALRARNRGGDSIGGSGGSGGGRARAGAPAAPPPPAATAGRGAALAAATTSTTPAGWSGVAVGRPALGGKGAKYVVRSVPVQVSREKVNARNSLVYVVCFVFMMVRDIFSIRLKIGDLFLITRDLVNVAENRQSSRRDPKCSDGTV